jgi:hypothetical protein
MNSFGSLGSLGSFGAVFFFSHQMNSFGSLISFLYRKTSCLIG